MRIPNWPALVCGLVLAATIGRSAVAAPPNAASPGKVSLSSAVDDSDDDDEADSETVYRGPGPHQAAQFVQPSPGGYQEGVAPEPGPGVYYGPGMTPPTAWPEVSPHSQHRMQETYNSGGLWHFNTDDEFDFKNVLAIDYLYGSGLKPGNHSIGNRSPQFFDGQPLTFPGTSTNGFGNVQLDGFRIGLGREYAGGSGIMLSGFILFENSLDNGRFGYVANGADVSTLRANWGIAVNNGDGSQTVLPFDTSLYMRYTQNINGADADIFLTPFYEWNTFKLKFVFGAKYLRIHEEFYVQGNDSGLGYIAGQDGGTTGDPATITGPFTTITPTSYGTYFAGSTTNNLVGPQLGLKYELGGEKFKIWGQTRFGLAADVQQSWVTSGNVNAYKAPGIANTVIAGPDTLFGPGATTSSFRNTLTHISPFIDTSISGEFPGFELIPWVNQWQLFKKAKMRVGWNYVYVGQVARAADIINYNLHGATINNENRSQFRFSTVNFAVDWKF